MRETDETYIECRVCNDVPRDGECRSCGRGKPAPTTFKVTSVDPWRLAGSA